MSTHSNSLRGQASVLKTEILEQFSCNGCGDCCRWNGSVLLTEQDITCLADFFKLSEEQFISEHTRLAPNRRQLALLDQPNGSCAFLEGNRCSVYAVRPEQCRNFPFSWHVAEGCPELDRLLAAEKNIDQAAHKP